MYNQKQEKQLMRIALLEDDLQEREEFLDAFHAWDPTRIVECYSSIAELKEAAERKPYITVAFLDIYLPKESGMDAAAMLRETSAKTEIVFVTTSQDHAIEAFNMNAMHYILKPVNVDEIRDVFERLRKKNAEVYRPCLYLKTGKVSQMVYLDDITSVHSDNHQVHIYLKNGGEICSFTRLLDIEKQLDSRFIKLQRGIIVHADYIERMSSGSCTLKDGTQILLSRKNMHQIRQAYEDYIFSHLANRKGYEL